MNRVEQLESQLNMEKARHEAAESKWLSQYSHLAQNNTALARKSNRLSQQVDCLKAEIDQLRHAMVGQAAVHKAKNSEHLGQVETLTELLRKSAVAQDALKAQLKAKQEYTKYLEWRITQLETFVTANNLNETTSYTADSFEVLPDNTESSGSQLGSASNVPSRSVATKLDFQPGRGVLQPLKTAVRTNIDGDGIIVEDTSVEEGSDGQLAFESTTPRSQHKNLAGAVESKEVPKEEKEADENVNVTERKKKSKDPVLQAVLEPHTPVNQLVPQDDEEDSDEGDETPHIVHKSSTTPPTSHPGTRTSTRVRPAVSYVLPSVSSKLRQGDKFTFGDTAALRSTGKKKSQHGSRTKPRAKYHRIKPGRRSETTLEPLEENKDT